jgi:hypothetical protein
MLRLCLIAIKERKSKSFKNAQRILDQSLEDEHHFRDGNEANRR